jgi:hypothetical protein
MCAGDLRPVHQSPFQVTWCPLQFQTLVYALSFFPVTVLSKHRHVPSPIDPLCRF